MPSEKLLLKKLLSRRHLIILIAIFSLPAIILLLSSLKWHYLVDSSIFQYIARKILDGFVPYRDIFDMNMPGIYWIHMLTLIIFGKSNLGFRIIDLFFLVITLFSGGKILKSFGIISIAIFIVTFAGIHLSGGEVAMGERDFFMTACLSVSVYLYLKAFDKLSYLNFFLSGLFLGYATCIKPTCILWLCICCFMLFFATSLNKKIKTSGLVYIISGYVVFPSLFLLWLGYKGGLSAFVDMSIHYLPIYNQGAKNSIFTLISTIWQTPVGSLLAFSVISIPFLDQMIHDQSNKRIIILIVSGILFSILHYFIQGTNFYYHLYPLYFFTSLYFSIIVYYLFKSEDRRIKAMAFLLTISWMCILNLYIIPTIFKKPNLINQYDRQVAEQPALIDEIVSILHRDSIQQHEKVQVFDMVGGGCNVLLDLNADTPTRFLLELHFTEMGWKGPFPPYLQRLWDEFIFGLYAHKPKYIVLFKSSYFYSGNASNIVESIELKHFIHEYYTPLSEAEKYIIYKINDY